jgi:threonine/homoserine/homoserine lactone efflux protein
MVDDIWSPLLGGALAGLGVAMPLGAISALLLREGVVNGFRVAMAAAAGVATVDLLYCAVATATGTLLVQVIEDQRGILMVVSGVVIVAIGARQLHRSKAERSAAPTEVGTASRWGAYGRYVGLTAINPLTLVYFVALGAAVTASRSWPAPVLFVAAAGLTSLAWQLVLAGIGSFVGGAMGFRATRAIGAVAALLVIALGASVLISGAFALA